MHDQHKLACSRCSEPMRASLETKDSIMKKNLLIAVVLTTFAAVSFAQAPTPSPTAAAATPVVKHVHKVKHAHSAKKAPAPAAAASVTK